MKRLLSIAAAVLVSGAIAYGAYIPYLSGPQDPSQLLSTINTLINSIKAGVNGIIAVYNVTTNSAGTTNEQTLASAVIPGNTLIQNGQGVQLRCSGTFANTSHASTSVKLYYGTSSVTSVGATTAGQGWDLALLVTYGASPTDSKYVGNGSVSTTVVAPNVGDNTTDDLRTNLTAKCTATQGTASANDTVLQNFIVEQVK